MAFPNMGQGAASSQVGRLRGAQKPMQRVQTPTAKGPMGMPRITGYGGGGLGSGSPLMGGGGMAVGDLRNPRGQALHPAVSRRALLQGLK